MRYKILNIEFEAKKEGKRFRIPSKFNEIDINCEILYSFSSDADPDQTNLQKSYYGIVRKKRYVSLPSTELPQSHALYIIIFRVNYPRKIVINRSIKQRITSRGQIKLPPSLGLADGDQLRAKLEENVSQDIRYASKQFETGVTKEGYIRLPISMAEFESKDRFHIKIIDADQLPSNQRRYVYGEMGQLNWICLLQKEQEFEITYTSDFEDKSDLINTLKQKIKLTGSSYLNFIEIDELYIPIFKHISDPESNEPICILALVPTSNNFPIFTYMDQVSEFYSTSLRMIDSRGWQAPILRSKYQDFANYLMTTTEIRQNIENLPRFLPVDLVDREKYDEIESAILSIIVAKMIDHEELVTLSDLENLIDMDNIKHKVQDLVQRGILVERINDIDITGYAFPRFTIPMILKQVERDKTLVMIVHSFGGGVAKTTFSCNFSRLMGNLGLKTILIDFDFINSRLSTIFKKENREKMYLNHYLIRETPIESIIQSTQWPNLDLILTDPEGDVFRIKTPNQETNLNYFTKLTALIQQLRTQYDFIIIDAEGSIDYNIINAFLLSDISFILSNGNETSLKGLMNRSKLILQRTGINIRNDYLIQTLVPSSKLDLAMERSEEWKHRFSQWGIRVIASPMVDEELVREYIYENRYFLPENTKFYEWMKKLLLEVPRLRKWSKLQQINPGST